MLTVPTTEQHNYFQKNVTFQKTKEQKIKFLALEIDTSSQTAQLN